MAGSITFGFILGLSPLLSLQGLLLLFGLFVFNFSWGVSILSTLFFAGVTYLFASFFHQMGEFILNIHALEGVFTFFYNSPLIPYTHFNNTVVMGSGFFALLFSPVVFFLSRALTEKYLKRGPGPDPGLDPDSDSDSRSQTRFKQLTSLLRKRVVASLLVMGVLIVVYVIFFLDAHLRRGVQWASTRIYGAEVNIGELDISFTQCGFLLRNLQVTDQMNPLRNLIEVDRVELQFLWDALLRKKFVVDRSTVEGIQILAPREKPGQILSSKKSSSDFSLEEGLKNEADQWIQALDNPSEFAKIKEIPLQSDERMKELRKSLKEKEKKWSAKLKSVPQVKENLEKAKKLRFDKNPFKALKEAKNLYLESRKDLKSHKKIYDGIRQEIKSLTSSLGSLGDLAQEDFKKLKKDVKSPNITLLALSTYLFGSLFQQGVAVIRNYIEMGREYMPPPPLPPLHSKEGLTQGESSVSEGGGPSAAGKGESLASEKGSSAGEGEDISLGEGRDVSFPITSYPVFWIKEVRLSSLSHSGIHPVSQWFLHRKKFRVKLKI